jgi:hypothetical protein
MSSGIRATIAEIDLLRSAIDKYLESGTCDQFDEQVFMLFFFRSFFTVALIMTRWHC